jgi:hypothetical protein
METSPITETAHLDDALLVLWTTADRETVLNMVFMYTTNARRHGWWQQVTLLVWGAATRALCEDDTLRQALKEAQNAGVGVIACRRCAEMTGVMEKLKALGVKVFYTGEYLTNWLKSGKPLLSV